MKAYTISDVDYIVETDNQPLMEIPVPASSEIDRQIAKTIVEMIEDGSCIQLGIGAMPNAGGMMIAQSDLKDLGGQYRDAGRCLYGNVPVRANERKKKEHR